MAVAALHMMLHQPAACGKSLVERSHVGLFWPAGHYCGPANGGEYSQPPRDALDAICAQHDFCIEHSFPNLYPKARDEAKCGMALGAWRVPSFAGRIMACDVQMIRSIVGTFECVDERVGGERLPRSPWCDAEFGLLGRRACDSRYEWLHPLGVPCRLSAWLTSGTRPPRSCAPTRRSRASSSSTPAAGPGAAGRARAAVDAARARAAAGPDGQPPTGDDLVIPPAPGLPAQRAQAAAAAMAASRGGGEGRGARRGSSGPPGRRPIGP